MIRSAVLPVAVLPAAAGAFFIARRVRLRREADAALAAWETRIAERDRMRRIDADLVVTEARHHDTLPSSKRTVDVDWVSLQCSSLRHHACRPLDWDCKCECHGVMSGTAS